MIEDVCASLDRRFEAQKIDIVLDVPRSLGMMADRAMLREALSCLMANAAASMASGGRLVVTSFIGAAGLELEVADSGPSLLDYPQHNAGTASHGSRGNNLDNVRSIVEAHGGTVRVANCPEGGVAYTLHFPGHAARRAA
jgi:signal transduction histidine kinase